MIQLKHLKLKYIYYILHILDNLKNKTLLEMQLMQVVLYII
jgi:hypothetical protein